MWTRLCLISILFLTNSGYLFGQVSKENKSCKTEIDSLTKQLVYVTADVRPVNEGGDAALRKKIEKDLMLDTAIVAENYGSKVIVAFIVNTDGNITGCRIIEDKTSKVGLQILNIVKSFKWTPAKCDNKSVAMIYKVPLILDPEEQ